MSSQYESIQTFINQKILPGVASHGGGIEIVNLQQNVLQIRLSGACDTCSIQAFSAESISNYLLEEFPDLEDVIVSE